MEIFFDSVTVDSGVPQGTVLGPLLFLCHINNLPDCVKSQVRLFADDCLLYRTINSQSDHLTFQKDLEALEKWASDWGMRFNAKKCYLIYLYLPVFTCSRHHSKPQTSSGAFRCVSTLVFGSVLPTW